MIKYLMQDDHRGKLAVSIHFFCPKSLNLRAKTTNIDNLSNKITLDLSIGFVCNQINAY